MKRIISAILIICLFAPYAVAANVEMDIDKNNQNIEDPFLFFDTYDDRLVDWPLVDTGYGYQTGKATNFNVNIVNYENDNNVLKLSTKPHQSKSATDENLTLLYCNMHIYDGSFIVENDFNLSEENSRIRFFIRGTASSEIENLAIVENGALYAGSSAASTGVRVSENEWHNIAVLTDLDTMRYEVLFDGQPVFNDKFSVLSRNMISNDTSSFRLEMITEPETDAYLLLDNFKIYRGSEILEDEYLEKFRPAPFFLEREEGAETQKLKGAVVYALDTPMFKLFSKNREIDKNNLNITPYLKNGKHMIPLRLTAEAFGQKVDYDGNVYIISDNKSIRLESDGKCFINDTFYKSVQLERQEDSFFVDAEELAELLEQKLQTTKNGLIILSETSKFYDEQNDSFAIDALGKLLTSSKHGPRLISQVSDEFFEEVRERIAKNEDPYKRAWEATLENANTALTKEYPMILNGYDGEGYNKYAFLAGNAIRDLAFVYRVTNDVKYAERARELLAERVNAPNPFNVYRSFLGGDWAMYNTLVPARSGVAVLYGYTFLYPYLDREMCDKVELWAGRLAAGAKYVQEDWLAHDCYDQQYWQNHMVLGEMLMIASAIINQDIDQMYWVTYNPDNPRNMTDLVTGCIIMGPEDEMCVSDPTLTSGAPQPERGEIYDRYRMKVGKGFHYANLTARGLLIDAEMLYQNGYDFYDYYGENGERLEYVFEYYGEYFVQETVDIKSGYYVGSPMNTTCAVFPIALSHYPYNTEIRRTCLDVRQLAQTDDEQVGWLSCLTHGAEVIEIKDSSMPEVRDVKINGRSLENFRRDKHTYNIPVFAHEAKGASLEFDTTANIIPLTSDDRWAPQSYLVFDKEDMNKREVYKFTLDILADTEIPQNASAVGCSADGASGMEEGNSPELTLDGDESTIWTFQGVGGKHWIQYKLDEPAELAFVTLQFTRGAERSYFFSIDISEDGKSYKEVFDSKSSGKTVNAEIFRFEPQMAQYVRIRCEGNTANEWNNIAEFKAYTLK